MVTEQRVLYGVKRSGRIYCPNKSQTGHLWETCKVRNVEACEAGGSCQSEIYLWSDTVLKVFIKMTLPDHRISVSVFTCEISNGIYSWSIYEMSCREKSIYPLPQRSRLNAQLCCFWLGWVHHRAQLCLRWEASEGSVELSWGYTLLGRLPWVHVRETTTSVTRIAANWDVTPKWVKQLNMIKLPSWWRQAVKGVHTAIALLRFRLWLFKCACNVKMSFSQTERYKTSAMTHAGYAPDLFKQEIGTMGDYSAGQV